MQIPEPDALSSTQKRLIAAARKRIAEAGLAEASARSIAKMAEANASAINYNLGGIEQLYAIVFTQAVNDTAAWLDRQRQTLDDLPAGSSGASMVLEYVVEAWTMQARDLALLYQEALSWAGADRDMLARWARLWSAFWAGTAAHCGLDATCGQLMNLFFQSEALYHLSSWSPALERAAMRDLCDHFARVWLGAPRQTDGDALKTAQDRLHGQNVVKLPPVALKQALSAVAVVQEKGLLGLTHRAVAAHAGVTVGAVTHYFRTAEDLVAGAIRGQVEQLFMAQHADSGAAVEGGAIPTLANFAEGIDASVASAAVTRVLSARRALFLASLRAPDAAGAGAVVRFGYGRTTQRILSNIIDRDRDLVPLHADVLSRLVSSLWMVRLEASPSNSGISGRDIVGRLEDWLATRPPTA